MLESIPTATLRLRVFRLANQGSVSEFLQEQGLDERSIDEIKVLLQSRGVDDSLEELCDAPFRPKPRLKKAGYATRFSDGSFPVLYTSLEAETAENEIKHWFLKFAGSPAGQRTAYYSRFACDFIGTAKDLRPERPKWPGLTHDSDYLFCNRLGVEAVNLRLDGLLTPSARRTTGTNLPVFARRSISNPGDCVLVAVTYDPSTGKVLLDGWLTRSIQRGGA